MASDKTSSSSSSSSPLSSMPFSPSGVVLAFAAVVGAAGCVMLTVHTRVSGGSKTDNCGDRTDSESEGKRLPLPPGNTGWRWFGGELGMMMRLGTSSFYDHKRRELAEIVNAGSGSAELTVARTHVNGHDAVVVFGIDNLRALDKLERSGKVGTGFSSRLKCLLGEQSLAGLNGHMHKIARQRITRVLSSSALASNLHAMDAVIAEKLAAMAGNGAGYRIVDFGKEMHKLVWDVMSQVLCGEGFFGGDDGSEKALWHIQSFGCGLSSKATPEQTRAATASKNWLHDKFRTALRALNQDNSTTATKSVLLRHLQDSKDEEGVTMDEQSVVESATLLMFASVDTTSSLLLSMVRNFFMVPGTLEKAAEEVMDFNTTTSPSLEDLARLKYLDACVKETLAHDDPFASMHRVAFEDIELGGFRIPKGWELHVAMAQMLRDSVQDQKHIDFHPERWFQPGADKILEQRGFKPWGSGPHMCPGRLFPPAETKLFFVRLIQGYRLGVVELPTAWAYKPALLPAKGRFLVTLAKRE